MPAEIQFYTSSIIKEKRHNNILFRYFLMFLVWAATHTHLLWKEMSSYLCMPLGKQLFRMWKTHCSSNTPSSLCLGDTCSKQCDKTHQCLNKVPLWWWTKQHVSFRPCSNHQGGTQQPHSYTHTTSLNPAIQLVPLNPVQSDAVACSAASFSGRVFGKRPFSGQEMRATFQLTELKRSRRTGLYLKQRQREETQKEKVKRSQVWNV